MKGIKGVFGKAMVGRHRPAQNSSSNPSAPAPAPAPVNQQPAKWDAIRFKVNLKMARNRVDIIRGKKSNEIDAARRVVAQHLAQNKESLARIQGEVILRERMSIEAFDVVVTLIDLLAASNTVFGQQRDFDSTPHDLRESVASIIYASSRLNVPELHVTTQMFRAHFGPHIVDPLLRLEGPHISLVNKMLARNLSGGTPDGYLVLEELSKIAAEHQISWIPPPEDSDLDHHGGHDPGRFRPVPGGFGQDMPYMGYPQHPGGPPGPSAPPPGGPGGDFGMMAPTNIPGHNPYGGMQPGMQPGMPPYGGHVPSAAPSAPPFDQAPGMPPPPGGPGGNIPGMMPYPHDQPPFGGPLDPRGGPPPFGGDTGGSLHPPPLPQAQFISDDDLEAKFQNIKRNM